MSAAVHALVGMVKGTPERRLVAFPAYDDRTGYLVVPPETDLKALHGQYLGWLAIRPVGVYPSFPEWLVANGHADTAGDSVEVFGG